MNVTRIPKLSTIPIEDRLDTLDNAEIRYNVHVRYELGDKLAKYFRLQSTAGELAPRIWHNLHAWKKILIIQGEQYEVAFRECTWEYLAERKQCPDDTKFLLSVRAAKDGRTRVVLIVPWDSYAAQYSIGDNIPKLEY